jgi:hypothetical protein
MSDKDIQATAAEEKDLFPSDEEIAALKEKYSNLELIELGGEVYVYRGINRAEHRMLLQSRVLETAEDADFEIVKRFLVWPEPSKINWEEKGAGVIPTLSQHIMRLSGFVAGSNPVKL